jgi:hypothetical protein
MPDDTFINPFRSLRAEQEDNLWQYYVPVEATQRLGTRPLVLEGGRGSGKTMFFRCNSWREQTRKLEAEGKTIEELLRPPAAIGLYYRVDTAFVTALQGTAPSPWESIFATYLSLQLLIELIGFLSLCQRTELVATTDVATICERFHDLTNAPVEATLQRLRYSALRLVDQIERATNGRDDPNALPGSIPGRLFGQILDVVMTLPRLHHTRFHVFIDEYESLLEYQQRQVNTLIKHSTSAIVYNVGLRQHSMLTTATVSNTERIEPPHDYTHVQLDSLEAPDALASYKAILTQIVHKRISNAGVLTPGAALTEISQYLGQYDADEELRYLGGDGLPQATLDRLYDVIREHASDELAANDLIRRLVTEAPPANARLHLALLLRTEHYRPSPADLANEFEAWRARGEGGSKRYNDWWHNTKVGLLFLLAAETQRRKRYYGFDTFALLSSGIVRYFLELCEQAFEHAHANEFRWDQPRSLTADEQDTAARAISRHKLELIPVASPSGVELQLLTLALGTIFERLHRNPQTTLSQPEINQFWVSRRDLASDERLHALLDEAVTWTILQERTPTKEKQLADKIDTADYQFTRIFAPYFRISYRAKRKIELRVSELRALAGLESGNMRGENRDRARAALQDVLRRVDAAHASPTSPPDQPQLFEG